jgi:hypothetical protein
MCFNWNTLFTGNKQGTVLPSAKHNQGQLQTLQSQAVTACEHCMWFLGKCCYDVLSCSRLGCHLVSSLPRHRCTPRIFHWGSRPELEDTYSLFDFKKLCYKNHVINITNITLSWYSVYCAFCEFCYVNKCTKNVLTLIYFYSTPSCFDTSVSPSGSSS